MNKINMLVRVLHRAERNVSKRFLIVGERHKSDHEVYHLTRDFARWSDEHVQLLAEHGRRMGFRLNTAAKPPHYMCALRETGAQLFEQRPESGVVLLRDLRKLHLDLSGLSVDWELLGQAAQGVKDDELLQLTQRCHPDTLRQARWANSMIKVIAPQALAN